MARPRLKRRIRFCPRANYFKPVGIPLRHLEVIHLELDEGEALRLRHLQNLSQSKAAEEMKISQSTFHRILQKAYDKVAEAMVTGKAVRIE
ncbi:hypothetical protein DRH29_00350 [candidate division Kazan bacterium]|uniref:UPF0251 protein DRH29_00350 n=1 Tax=candidate division Kazan bacterium TaxID=2202143 RepID=A0A420ZE06_UNCK3|nr:MAG: hypothetical protein DRH29_00350 [candidate division Kazan bacterium]